MQMINDAVKYAVQESFFARMSVTTKNREGGDECDPVPPSQL